MKFNMIFIKNSVYISIRDNNYLGVLKLIFLSANLYLFYLLYYKYYNILYKNI